ncbi:putative ankyrin repeat protein RF_0381 [Phymastichus coffea]|uniref:putative ankyrin repeat protein RF_0381 n=1 Tax=Phymastichus coffea TaxID=108790 RepID=UPI00273C8C92|nr:putative ankyrin repeat protein RF_0381 [Phymastichus coffea]
MVLLNINGIKQFDPQLLTYIATNNNAKVVDMLKKVDARKLRDCWGKTLLHWSADEPGNPEITRYLIEKDYNINAQDIEGNTPLGLAVESDQMEIIKVLVEANANIYIPNNSRLNPIEYVLRYWNLSNTDIVKWFLNKLREDCGENKQMLVDKLMDFSCPIYFAVLLTDSEITQRMLDRKCAIDARCPETSDTALHVAVAQADLANARLLVERGLGVNCKGQQDETPIYRYETYDSDTDEKIKVLHFLVTSGADMYICKIMGTPPMERIMSCANKRTLDMMLNLKSIDLRRTNSRSETILHFVCKNDSPDAGQALLQLRGRDFDINLANAYEETGLMLATKRAYVSTVRSLLQLGAELEIEDKNFRTAIHLTYRFMSDYFPEPLSRLRTIADMLLMHGADPQRLRGGILLEKFKQKGDTYIAESILARLVEMEDQDESAITSHIRRTIQRCEYYQNYFDECKVNLEKMKSVTVFNTITLIDLLNRFDCAALSKLVCFDEFTTTYKLTMSKNIDWIPHYYIFVIQNRVIIPGIDYTVKNLTKKFLNLMN